MPNADLTGSTYAERRLGISRATLMRRVEAGEIPYEAKLDGPKGAYVFSRAAIDALAEQQNPAVAS